MKPDHSIAVKVSHLTKCYGGLTAVDQISFDVKKGEIFGFLGPNGAGKTTTVRILTGVIRADSGDARVMGYKAGTLKAKQSAGIVPEMANAYIDLSAWKNMKLMADIYGIHKNDFTTRSEDLLKSVGLFSRRHEPVRSFSRGMRQRLILVMSLVSDPSILFLDEPTTGLDVQSSRMIKTFLQELKQEGKTIFLTTHQMEEANLLCDRIAIINRGVIAKIDSPERIRTAIKGMHFIEVTFNNSADDDFLASVSAVESVEKAGDKYRLYTGKPAKTVVSLAQQVSARNMEIEYLNVISPSLEDAFVALTGGKNDE